MLGNEQRRSAQTSSSRGAGWSITLVVLALCSLPVPAPAATFTVDRFDDANGSCDPGDCSLREALLAAEANPGPDLILVPPGVHTLSLLPPGAGLASGVLDIALHDVEIVAPQGATIDAQGIDRVFRFLLSNSRLENLTITGGVGEGVGGGIYSEGSHLVLTNLWVHGNRAAFGGGIGVELGTVQIDGSTISGNEAGDLGGGLYVFGISQFNVGRIEVRNSTISGNHAGLSGGGTATVAAGQLRIEYSTVVGNTNRPGDQTLSGMLDPFYTLVEGRCSAGPEASCIYRTSQADELPVADLQLGPLVMNGGLTPTHALLPGSPAIDLVPAEAACPDSDQRGEPRPQDGTGDGTALCDAGAFERRGPFLVEVPALGELGLVLLALLLALFGVGLLRR